jgi:sugar O-acyltransferase (sialic acid O-acetyltransferase NeuD family)
MPHPSAPEALVIVGGGGLAREMIWLARDCPAQWTVRGILDDDPALAGSTIDGVPVIGPVADGEAHRDAHLHIAIGAPRVRRHVEQRLGAGHRWATLRHPSAIVAGDAAVAEGALIGVGAIVSSAARIGRHALVNMGAIVAHDSILLDFATLAPGVVVPGAVEIGRGAEIALGAAVRQGTRIGDGALVGMNATVTRDVPHMAVMVGSPARAIRLLEQFR